MHSWTPWMDQKPKPFYVFTNCLFKPNMHLDKLLVMHLQTPGNRRLRPGGRFALKAMRAENCTRGLPKVWQQHRMNSAISIATPHILIFYGQKSCVLLLLWSVYSLISHITSLRLNSINVWIHSEIVLTSVSIRALSCLLKLHIQRVWSWCENQVGGCRSIYVVDRSDIFGYPRVQIDPLFAMTRISTVWSNQKWAGKWPVGPRLQSNSYLVLLPFLPVLSSLANLLLIKVCQICNWHLSFRIHD